MSSPKTASALGGRVVPAPSPHLARIWRLLEESVCSLAWPSWPFYLFFINHPLPPPDPACPAPLNRLQFVSSEWCRALPARPGVAVLRLEGKEGPLSHLQSGAFACRSTPLLGSAGCSPSSFLTEQSLSIYFLSFVLKCQVGRPWRAQEHVQAPYAVFKLRRRSCGVDTAPAGRAGPLKSDFHAWA